MEFVFIALKMEIVLLLSFNKDIESHKSTCKFTGPEDEVDTSVVSPVYKELLKVVHTSRDPTRRMS